MIRFAFTVILIFNSSIYLWAQQSTYLGTGFGILNHSEKAFFDVSINYIIENENKGYIIYAGLEDDINSNIYGLKLGAFAFGNQEKIPFIAGINAIQYQSKSKNALAIRPELGLGGTFRFLQYISTYKITYGLNFYDQGIEQVNKGKHVISFYFVFPMLGLN